ncbi:MAG: methionyl-tRNA formyltransferase [Pirellulales bacterium]|nr:methionyl-tRNA formyltransferase [Pirellulales bacterium]
MPEALNIIIMGTGPFAVPLFEALAASRHLLCALITQPTRPVVGNKPPPVNPMRQVAERFDIQVLTPQSVNTGESRKELERFSPDLFVVADYGQILKPETLAVARLGGVNLHGSLLPKYRGAAPINWAIYNGETETGVTVIQMTPRIDAGPTIAQAVLAIGAEETAEDLEPRLAILGAGLIRESVDKLAEDPQSVRPLSQSPADVTRAPRLKKTDGEIDWSRTAQQVSNQWRAMQPWPKCYSHWLRAEGQPLRLIFGPLKTVKTEGLPPGQPGEVTSVRDDEIVIATGAEAVLAHALQPAGKRMLTVAEFLNGYSLQPGDRFGTP